jgi:hypothetical protein
MFPGLVPVHQRRGPHPAASAPNNQAFWAWSGKAWFQAWWGAPCARNSVDLVITGIDRNRRTPEPILSGEGAFSSAKNFIPGRNALAGATIEATECLKAWGDHGLVHRD